MAPLGPLPEMVSKLISRSWLVARRKPSSRRTASISSSAPVAAAPSSQARKRATASPSRRCAARAPLISVAFLLAFSGSDGIGPARDAPWCRRARARTNSPRYWGSRRTRLPAVRSAFRRSASAAGSLTLAKVSRCARTAGASLSAAMNSSGLPLAGTIAKASATGVCGMSEPRMLNSQATLSLSVRMTASCLSALRRFWMSAILSCAERPANFCGCSVTGSAGAGGRARPHTRSTRLRAVGRA